MRTHLTEVINYRRGLSAEERNALGEIGRRLAPSGGFNPLPCCGASAGQRWRSFCNSNLTGWCEARRTAAVVLLAAEIRADINSLLNEKWTKPIKSTDRRLNTVLARLANVSSGAVGNAFRVLEQEPDVFKAVVLGQRAVFPWFRTRQPLGRDLVIKKFSHPLNSSLARFAGKVSLFIVNTGASDAPMERNWVDLENTVIGDAVKLGGYLVWIRDDPSEDEPYWFLGIGSDYKGATGSATHFSHVSESVLLQYGAGSSFVGWKRVSVLQKCFKSDPPPGVVNEVIGDFHAITNKLPSSDVRAFAQLMRHFCKRRRQWVFAVTQDPSDLSILKKAAKLADQKLLVID